MLTGPILQTDTQILNIVLMLHGYGSNGQDLLNVAYHWQDALPHTLFVAPNAPYEYTYVDNGYMWFDFGSVENISTQDVVQGLDKIRPTLKQYLQHLSHTYDVPLSRITPMGFSQGAMIALDLLTTQSDIKYAMGYSGIYCQTVVNIEQASSKKALLVHGSEDHLVSYAYLSKAQSALTALGIHVTPVTCAGLGHSINQEGIAAGKTFLKENL